MHIYFIILLLFFIENSVHPIEKNKNEMFDENLFKNEIQNTVLEFIDDLDLNPDSCYMPFKEK